jgi:nitrous oxidase accessory protein
MRRLALISLLAAVLAPLGKGADAVADLQAMIDATPAGATLTIGPGSYTGRLTISRPITIVGEGYPIIDAAGTGTVITVNAPDVTIQGLIIRGSGSSHDHEDAGITVTAPRVRIVAN